jgi:hypothetical protein
VGATTGVMKKKADKTTCCLLEAVYYLGLVESNLTATSRSIIDDGARPPASVDGIVSLLLTEMSLKDRVIVANMKEAQLELLQPTLGRHIQIRLEYWRQSTIPNAALEQLEKELAGTDDISTLIIKKVWKKLRTTHRLRIIK